MPAPPRKLICVVGEASGVPGSGETATGLAVAMSALARGVLAEDVLPQAISAVAQQAKATGTDAGRKNLMLRSSVSCSFSAVPSCSLAAGAELDLDRHRP